jgi:hypothetical protein
VKIKFLSILGLGATLGVAGCSATDNTNATANANANATTVTSSNTTRPGPDDSEITALTDESGVRTETRVFHNNPRVSKVVVTTRNGQKTTTVYAPSGTAKELKDDVGDALAATGNTLADAAGFVADKAEDVAGKAADGAKTVANKTAEGAKKTGKAIKKAVTP